MVQLIDPVSQLRKWCHKIVHVHGKDATIDWNAVRHGAFQGRRLLYGTECRALATQTGAILFLS